MSCIPQKKTHVPRKNPLGCLMTQVSDYLTQLSLLLLMVQKSGDHQLRLVVNPIVYKVFLNLLVGCLEKSCKPILPNNGRFMVISFLGVSQGMCVLTFFLGYKKIVSSATCSSSKLASRSESTFDSTPPRFLAFIVS